MKKGALVLGLFFISLCAFSQEKSNVKRTDLMGPAYKNYKPWKYKTIPVTVYSVKRKESLLGPEYKNHKPWADTNVAEYVAISVGNNERLKLKGPAYKNYKPWKSKSK